MEVRLKDRQWIMGDDYTIADIAIFPWIRIMGGFYEGAEQLKLDEFPVVGAYLERCLARPASEIGLKVPA